MLGFEGHGKELRPLVDAGVLVLERGRCSVE
jgi:hypothetical protein